MKRIAILGATGSIGTMTQDIVRLFPGEFDVVCLSAHRNIDDLAWAANEFRPEVVALPEDTHAQELELMLKYPARVLAGEGALVNAVMECMPDLVVLAVVGIAGLPVFEACLQFNIPVALANKESLVCGADVIRDLMDETGTRVLPVDSEHSAIYQCLGDSYDITNVSKIWLTASGGPFLHWGKEDIEHAPLESALKHPNWEMGSKITIDSATLVNKGMEVIEAHFMYKAPVDMIEVVIQPQSLVHSMVEMVDSSVLAQLSPIDMRLPLQKAMLYPRMCKFTVNKPLNFKKICTIEFIEPDTQKFPALQLAYDAIESNVTAVYNTASEVAVAFYMEGRVHFGGIAQVIEHSMMKFSGMRPRSVEEILELDGRVREYIKGAY